LVSRVIHFGVMATVSIRDLRNHGGEVVERVIAGEIVTVTRSGRPVAELRPLQRTTLKAPTLLARWRSIPAVASADLKRDLDSIITPTV
jgi:prevent-host-death family protein